MNSVAALLFSLQNPICSRVERYLVEAVLGAKGEIELGMDELDALSCFSRRKIRVMEEIANGGLVEEDLPCPTRNLLHLMATTSLLAEEEGEEEENRNMDDEELGPFRFHKPARARFMSVEIGTEENEWSTTENFPSVVETISREASNFEEEATHVGRQPPLISRPCSYGSSEAMAADIDAVEKTRLCSNASLSSHRSHAFLTESMNIDISAARMMGEHEVSPPSSFWLASTAASSEYDADDEEESIEDLEKSVQEFLDMLEAELLTDEETLFTTEQVSRNARGSTEPPFAISTRCEETVIRGKRKSVNLGHRLEYSPSLASYMRAVPVSEFGENCP